MQSAKVWPVFKTRYFLLLYGPLTSLTLLLKKGISEALAHDRFKLGKFLLE